MGWILDALAVAFLELLGDLMSWTVNLISGLSLDVGMQSTVNADGSVSVTVPDIGTLIKPWAIRGNLLESTFPAAAQFTWLFLVLGFAIVMFLFLSKLAVGFGGPLVKTEPGGVVFLRTILATVGTAYSYSLFVLFESLFNTVYGGFMAKYIEVTKGADAYALQPDGGGNATEVTKNNVLFLGKKLIENYSWDQSIGLMVIAIALFTILISSYLRLVLEIFERYVMLGVLFYTSPLAFATLVSREMNVFKSWVTMVISEFIVMCSNLFFTGVFISAWYGKLSADTNALFTTPKDFITTMFLMISWLVIGQQFDQHLKSTSLATAQTGRGLGGAVLAGAGVAAMAGRMAVSGIYSAATGQTKWQRADRQHRMDEEREAEKAQIAEEKAQRVFDQTPEGKKKAFYDPDNRNPRISKNEAQMFISDMKSGGTPDFKNLSTEQQGQKIMQAAAALGGKDLEKAVLDQTQEGLGYVHNGRVSIDENGLITGETYGGGTFRVQVGEGVTSPAYISKDYGNGISVPMTNEQALWNANEQAAKMPRQIDGEAVTWQPDIKDMTHSTLAAYDKEGSFVTSKPVPNVITGDNAKFYDDK